MLKMATKKKIYDNLKINEGYRDNVYQDTLENNTIGYGHNLDLYPLTPVQLHRILEDRKIGLEQLLYDDVTQHSTEVFKRLKWLSEAPINVQIVLVDMAFNMGLPNLLTFKKTLKLLKNGKYKKASKELLNSLYAKQTKSRAKRNAKLIKNCV